MLERCLDGNALINVIGPRHRCIPKPKKDPTNGNLRAEIIRGGGVRDSNNPGPQIGSALVLGVRTIVTSDRISRATACKFLSTSFSYTHTRHIVLSDVRTGTAEVLAARC